MILLVAMTMTDFLSCWWMMLRSACGAIEIMAPMECVVLREVEGNFEILRI